jgi:hypothetical protein
MIEIKKYSPTDHKVKAVIYGKSGSGKTTFAATAPKPIFASAEQGLLSIRDNNIDYVNITTLAELQELILFLKKGEHDYETLVIDSISEINEIIKAGIEKGGRAMQLQDWGTLAREIRNLLMKSKMLDMHILFIAQEKVIEVEGDRPTKMPSMNGKAAGDICYAMDIVGYAHVNKNGEHKIITSAHPDLHTKDRSGLIGVDNNANFSEWVERISKIKIGEEKVEKVVDPIKAMKDEAINALPDKEVTPKKDK